MNKELDKALESLESIALWSSDYDDVGCYNFEKEYKIIKQALQRLGKIDNANPNEALKHFNHFSKWYRKICYRVVTSFELDYDLEIIKQYILKTQEQEKALNVIFEKGVDVGYLKTCKTLEEYNDNCWDDKEDFNKKLTQEEFDLLKEMLK